MELKLIGFNILYTDNDNGYSVVERVPRLTGIIDKYDADIIGFQEYCPATWKDYLWDHYGDTYDMFHKYRNQTTPEKSESTPIFWKKGKFDCLKTGFFWLSDTPEIESRGWDELYNCYRICVYVILREKETGQCVTVMNTHFGFGDAGQIKSAGLIARYVKKISDYPTIILGDFNMTPETPGYQEMSCYFTDVNAATVNDTGVTFHGYDPEWEEACHIDYCFVDDKVRPVTQQIIREMVDGKYPSDHYGLYIEVDI